MFYASTCLVVIQIDFNTHFNVLESLLDLDRTMFYGSYSLKYWKIYVDEYEHVWFMHFNENRDLKYFVL